MSTLGKFKVFGPDAQRLLSRIYVNDLKSLSAPKILYAASCNEAGVLVDDGVIIKKGPEEFYLTTSSARAPAAKEWFLRWRREEEAGVWIVDLTENLAALSLAGPRSGEILGRASNADLSDSGQPFMTWLELDIKGIGCLVLRIGFPGGQSYELHCPAGLGPRLWQTLMEAGQDLGLRPMGLEAVNVCRLEMGHVIIGVDVDGHTTLHEAGLSRMWDRSKEDLVGGPMLALLENETPKRMVAGFSLEGRAGVREGHRVTWGRNLLGHVTSTVFSQALGRTVGLCLIKPDPDALAQKKLKIVIQDKGGRDREVWARLERPPFSSPRGGSS